MTIEAGTSHNGEYRHRALAPRKQKGLGFEIPATVPQLDTLNKFVHDERIPAPVAYGIQSYIDRCQMTKEMASDILDMLVAYTSKPHVKPVTEPGIYVDKKTGAFYLVKRSQINRLYAMDLVINDLGERNPDGTWKVKPRFEWVYQNGHGTVKKLSADWKATPEQMKQWGDIWGYCLKCHAELTRQDSIDRGMGKTCWEKQFG